MDDPRKLGDPGRDSFRVESYPFYLLNRLVGRYNALISTRLRAIGIDVPTWRVLMILGERAPRGIGDIADAAVINVSTMTRIIQRMTRDGLLLGESLPGDARVTLVRLTPMAQAKLAEARRITAPIYAQVIQGFSRREFEALTAALRKMSANLEG